MFVVQVLWELNMWSLVLFFADCENKKNSSSFLSPSEFFNDEENIKKYQQHIAWNGKVGNSIENILAEQACRYCWYSGVWHLSSFLLEALGKWLVRSGSDGWKVVVTSWPL